MDLNLGHLGTLTNNPTSLVFDNVSKVLSRVPGRRVILALHRRLLLLVVPVRRRAPRRRRRLTRTNTVHVHHRRGGIEPSGHLRITGAVHCRTRGELLGLLLRRWGTCQPHSVNGGRWRARRRWYVVCRTGSILMMGVLRLVRSRLLQGTQSMQRGRGNVVRHASC
jgi:hypothetical protein